MDYEKALFTSGALGQASGMARLALFGSQHQLLRANTKSSLALGGS